MKKKKIMACALSAVAATSMMLGSTSFASDITGHWAESYLQKFIDSGYLSGYTDGTYKPNNNITRAEIATLVSKMEGYKDRADVSKYKDVISGQWYYNYVAEVVGADLMVGTSKTAWSPNTNITREQVCVIVCKLQGLERDTKSSDAELRAELKEMGFKDTEKISKWAITYVHAAVKEGYMAGTNKQLLNAQEPITRAEAVTLLSKCMPAENKTVYVTMNIPYDKFYEADVNNDAAVDAFTSATLNKTRTASLAGGSYHVNSDGSDITGISFPVKLGEGVTLADLAKYKQVTDDDSIDITVTNRGQTSTTTYKGVDALFENESYAYYVLNEEPAYYKEVTKNEDGSLSFGKVQGEVQTVSGVDAILTTESSYGDYELVLDGFDEIDTSTDKVYGVVVSTEENDYGMRHLENIWRVTDLAWSTGFTKAVHNCPTSSEHYKAMMGQTIKKVTYYTSKGIYEIPVEDTYVPITLGDVASVEDVSVKTGTTSITAELPSDFEPEYKIFKTTVTQGFHGPSYSYNKQDDLTVDEKGVISWDGSNTELAGDYRAVVSDKSGKYVSINVDFTVEDVMAYVMMNIPYSDFYEAELSENAVVDAVTSATKSKTLTGKSLAVGTYHVNSDGSDITGVSYPVMIAEKELAKLNQITDSDSLEITVTNRGQTSTDTYAGVEALFGAESYSYYLLNEEPTNYKVATVNDDGSISFGKAVGDVTTVENPEISFATTSAFGDYELDIIDDLPFAFGTDTIYAVAVNTKEGDSYGLRAVENIWRGTELGWCTGYTKEVHGSPASYEPYAPMMGQTITSLTYYTSKGIYNLDIEDTFVPTKLEMEASVADTSVSAGTVTVAADLPSGFEPEYVVYKTIASEGRHGTTYTYEEQTDLSVDANGVITWDSTNADLVGNAYRVTITDKSGKYVAVNGDFNITEAVEVGPKTYTGTATVDPVDYEDYEEEFGAEFPEYQILVDVTVENDTITAVELSSDCNVGENATYMRKAMKKAQTKYVGQTVADSASLTIDVASGATCSSNATERAIKDALAQIG